MSKHKQRPRHSAQIKNRSGPDTAQKSLNDLVPNDQTEWEFTRVTIKHRGT